MALIKNSQIVGCTLSEIYSQITWYYISQRGSVVHCLASIILLGKGGKEKTQKYHVNIIIIIVDPQHLFETWCLFLL